MPTVVDLGQKVKAKYPGQYDDLPDDQVGLKVQAKYPGQYDDFTQIPSTPQPTWLDRISTEMNGGGSMLDPKAIVNGLGSSLGRTTQAWSDFLTGKGISPSMVPLVGPMAEGAVQKVMTPGQRIEGLTDMGMLLSPALGETSLPAVPESVARTGAIAKGALKEGTKAAMAPIEYGLHRLPIPASLAGGAAGRFAGGEFGPVGSEIGTVIGAGTPFVRGAIKGGKSAAVAFDATKGVRPDIPAFDRPDWVPPVLPDTQVGIPSALPSGRVPGPVPQAPITPIVRPPAARFGTSPTVIPDLTPIPSELPSGRVPGGIQNQGPITPVVASKPGYPAGVDPDILDGLAQSTTGNPKATYLKLKGPQQDAAVNTARRLANPYADPRAAGVLAPDVKPVATLPDIGAPTPQAAGDAVGNGTENTSGLLRNLTDVVKKSADTNAETIAEHAGTIGHDLTTAKNATIAQHLADNGVTPAQWDALSMDDKNAWVKKVNAAKKTKYDPFGSNYRPGGYGRPAEEGARQVSDALRKVSK